MKKIYMIPDISRVKVELYNICAGSPQKIVWKVNDGGGEDEGSLILKTLITILGTQTTGNIPVGINHYRPTSLHYEHYRDTNII